MTKLEKIQKAVEPLGWSVEEDGDCYELENWSPNGEDLVLCVSKKDPVQDLKDIYDDFDPDEHAVMWYNEGKGAPHDLRALLDDADEIESMYEDLAIAVSGAIS